MILTDDKGNKFEFEGAHNWWPEIPLVTDLTKKPKGNNKVYCFDTPRGNLRQTTGEDLTSFMASEFRKSGFEPIKPHKLGIFENILNHLKIPKNYNELEKEIVENWRRR